MIIYFYYLPGKNSFQRESERQRAEVSSKCYRLPKCFVAMVVHLRFLASGLDSEPGAQWRGLSAGLRGSAGAERSKAEGVTAQQGNSPASR